MPSIKKKYGVAEALYREQTKKLVIHMAKEFATKEEIYEFILSRHPYMEKQPAAIANLFREALKEFINSDDFRDYKGLNSARLDQIIKNCVTRHKYGDAVKAIAEQNKILGNYEAELIKIDSVKVIF